MSLGIHISTGFLNIFLNERHSGNAILNFVLKAKSLSEVQGQMTLPLSYCKPTVAYGEEWLLQACCRGPAQGGEGLASGSPCTLQCLRAMALSLPFPIFSFSP